jgi:hypothetical protein
MVTADTVPPCQIAEHNSSKIIIALCYRKKNTTVKFPKEQNHEQYLTYMAIEANYSGDQSLESMNEKTEF